MAKSNVLSATRRGNLFNLAEQIELALRMTDSVSVHNGLDLVYADQPTPE